MKIKNYNLDFRRNARKTPARFFSLGASACSSSLTLGHRARSHLQRPTQIEIFRFILSIIFIAFLSLNMWGCGPTKNAEEIKKAVLEFEPLFKDALSKKAELDSQIDLMMTEFRKKQGEINSKIMELEEELKGVRRQTYSQVRDLKARLGPERQRIALKLNELRTTLKSKEGLLKTLKDSLKDTKKFVEKNKESGLSKEEEAKWQRNLNDLNSQVPFLEEEISKLRREIELYRQELNLLKQ